MLRRPLGRQRARLPAERERSPRWTLQGEANGKGYRQRFSQALLRVCARPGAGALSDACVLLLVLLLLLPSSKADRPASVSWRREGQTRSAEAEGCGEAMASSAEQSAFAIEKVRTTRGSVETRSGAH
jgi:hypothetical protein